MKIRTIISFTICLMFIVSSLNGQTTSTFETNNDETYSYLFTELPPIDTLYEHARLYSPTMQLQEVDIELMLRDLKTEKNRWWSYLRGVATYQYGVMASLLDVVNPNSITPYPSYSHQAQSWWNVGASLSIPLDDIINRGNLIEKAKANVRKAQYQADAQFDQLKIEIALAYTSASQSIIVSRTLYDRYNYAKAQYEIVEKNFLSGRTTSTELYSIKSAEATAYLELQKELCNLHQEVKKLEILTKTKIFTE